MLATLAAAALLLALLGSGALAGGGGSGSGGGDPQAIQGAPAAERKQGDGRGHRGDGRDCPKKDRERQSSPDTSSPPV
jgi:hypothetical protein